MIGIEFDRPNEVTFRTGPRKIAAEYRLAEGGVTFGKIRIEFCVESYEPSRRGG